MTAPVAAGPGHPPMARALDPLVALGPLFLLSVLYVNSGAPWSQNNVLGVPWLQEVYLAALLAYTAVAVLPRIVVRGRVTGAEVWVLALAFVPPLISAINALVAFGQPLAYGLVEGRRYLGYLVFFPVLAVVRRGHVSERRVLALILLVAAACYLNSVFLAAPDLDDPNRPDRVRIGTFYIVLAYLWAVVRWRGARLGAAYAALALVFGAYLVVYAQTRQLIVAAALFPLVLLPGRPRHLVTFTAVGASVWAAAAVGLWGGAAWADRYTFMFGRIVNMDLLEASVRAKTVGFILGDMKDGFLWGRGALSLLWRNGFHRVYFDHFFLSDVGLLGSAYQFGVPLALALLVFVHLAVWRALRYVQDDVVRVVGRAYVAFSVLISALIPTVEFHGLYLGLLWAIAEAARSRSPVAVTRQASPRQRARVQAGLAPGVPGYGGTG
jgi:hypothetical protein